MGKFKSLKSSDMLRKLHELVKPTNLFVDNHIDPYLGMTLFSL